MTMLCSSSSNTHAKAGARCLRRSATTPTSTDMATTIPTIQATHHSQKKDMRSGYAQVVMYGVAGVRIPGSTAHYKKPTDPKPPHR